MLPALLVVAARAVPLDRIAESHEGFVFALHGLIDHVDHLRLPELRQIALSRLVTAGKCTAFLGLYLEPGLVCVLSGMCCVHE